MTEYIKPLDRRYRDQRGVIVHVIGYEPATKQVIFMRPNYEHPCTRTASYVKQFFSKVKGGDHEHG